MIQWRRLERIQRRENLPPVLVMTDFDQGPELGFDKRGRVYHFHYGWRLTAWRTWT
jgi:hypothetical protein